MKRMKRTAAAILAALIASASLSSCFTVRVLGPRPKAEKKVVAEKRTGKKTVIKKRKLPAPKGAIVN